ANVDYFNGGLFEVVDPIELKRAEAYRLHEAARDDWSKVRPEIFGTLFQASMPAGEDGGRDERHAFGAHFTSEFDIRKVVGPTIVRPWRERIDAAGKNVGELRKALVDLRAFRVLDPACGSGNFLFIAYREMKRLERDILLRLREVSKREPLESAISLHQFFGIDIIPFAVELAKVTLMRAQFTDAFPTSQRWRISARIGFDLHMMLCHQVDVQVLSAQTPSGKMKDAPQVLIISFEMVALSPKQCRLKSGAAKPPYTSRLSIGLKGNRPDLSV